MQPSLPGGASSRHSSQRLLIACYGLPQHFDGSLVERRRERQLLVFVFLRRGQSERRRPELQREQREPLEQPESGQRSLRALRPASTRKLFIPSFVFFHSLRPGVARTTVSASAVLRFSNPPELRATPVQGSGCTIQSAPGHFLRCIHPSDCFTCLLRASVTLRREP